MRTPIYFRRGNIVDIPTLAQGEPGFALDTKKLYVGTATGNAQVAMATIEAIIAPTLLNGWVNFGGAYQTAGYYKDNFGVVHLVGFIKSGTTVTNTQLFVLPGGYAPLSTRTFTTYSNEGVSIGTFQVSSGGVVVFISGSNTDFSLDGVYFRTT